MIKDLRSFLDILRKENEVIEILHPVDPNLEIAEIHRRVIAAGGPTLFFKNVKGSNMPLVTNLFGTKKRVDLAFGVRPQNIIKEIASLPHELMPPTPAKLWEHRKLFMDLAHVGTKKISAAPIGFFQQQDFDLTKLPFIKSWKDDGGPFITLPLVYTEHPTLRIPNLGMYRIQIFDKSTTGLHTQIGKGAGFHLKAAQEMNSILPVNIHLGGPPALILSAIAPLPENVPEVLLASLLLREKLPLYRTPWSELPVVGNAEFCLVGYSDPNERRPEGPFGDHYGYYSLIHDYPVFHLKGFTSRRDPICTATVVGKPRQEDFFIGDYLQDLLSPLFPIVMPTVRDLWSYGETGYHSLSAAVVQQRYKREALVSAFRILGEGQLSLTKFLLVIDKPMDLKNFKEVLTHVLERADFRTDLYILGNLSMDSLDYTGPTINEGSKGILLGIGDPIRHLPNSFNGTLPSGFNRAIPFCPGCLVVEGGSYRDEKDALARLLKSEILSEWPMVVLVDNAQEVAHSEINFLWATFTRFEPAGDILGRSNFIQRNHLMFEHPIGIDARKKPWYPEELFCDPDTKNLVDKNWNNYFPAGMDMGDSNKGHLT